MAHASQDYQRDRKWSCIDGFLQSMTNGTGETNFVAFALFLQVDSLKAGLLSSLPLVAGACLQLISPVLVHKSGSHKRWVVWTSFVQALTFLPLVYFAWLGEGSYPWLLAMTTVYFMLGFSAGNAWNYWMSFLVPSSLSKRYFAIRSQWIQLGILAGMFVAGMVLKQSTILGVPAFAVLFAIAFVERTLSAYCLAQKTYEPAWLTHEELHPLGTLWRQLRASAGGPQIPFIVIFYFTLFLATPFYTPLMLKHLHLPYQDYMAILAVATLTRFLLYPLLGRLAEKKGIKGLYAVGCLGLSFVPFMWTFSTSLSYLFLVQIVQGICLASFEYAVFLTLFDGIAPKYKTQVLSVYSLLTSCAMVGGCLVGGQFLSLLGEQVESYYTLFWASGVLRALCLILLRPVSLSRLVPIQLAHVFTLPSKRSHEAAPSDIQTGS